MIAYSSGLKLDQAGLELANAGIVRVLAREAPRSCQRNCVRYAPSRGRPYPRELSALSAPWFLDRAYAEHYTAAIFANNRALAQAIGTRSPVFGARCHPSLADPAADAPFCAVTLKALTGEVIARLRHVSHENASVAAYSRMKGGSFGFRGHRFELIEPEQGRLSSCCAGLARRMEPQGLCELFAELAA